MTTRQKEKWSMFLMNSLMSSLCLMILVLNIPNSNAASECVNFAHNLHKNNLTNLKTYGRSMRLYLMAPGQTDQLLTLNRGIREMRISLNEIYRSMRNYCVSHPSDQPDETDLLFSQESFPDSDLRLRVCVPIDIVNLGYVYNYPEGYVLEP